MKFTLIIPVKSTLIVWYSRALTRQSLMVGYTQVKPNPNHE